MKFRGLFLLFVAGLTMVPEDANAFIFRMIRNLREARMSRRMMRSRCQSMRCRINRDQLLDRDFLIDNNLVSPLDIVSNPGALDQFDTSRTGLPVVQATSSTFGGIASGGAGVNPVNLIGDPSHGSLRDFMAKFPKPVVQNGREVTNEFGNRSILRIPEGFTGQVFDRATGQPVTPFQGQLVIQDGQGNLRTVDPRTAVQYALGYQEQINRGGRFPASLIDTLKAYAPLVQEWQALQSGGSYGGPGTAPTTPGQHGGGPAPTGRPTAPGTQAPEKFRKWQAMFSGEESEDPSAELIAKATDFANSGEKPWASKSIQQVCVDENKNEFPVTLTLFSSGDKKDPKKQKVHFALSAEHGPVDAKAAWDSAKTENEDKTLYKPQTQVGEARLAKWDVNGKPTSMLVNRYNPGEAGGGYTEAQIQVRALKSNGEPQFIVRYVYKADPKSPNGTNESDKVFYCKVPPVAPPEALLKEPQLSDTAKSASRGAENAAQLAQGKALFQAKCQKCHGNYGKDASLDAINSGRMPQVDGVARPLPSNEVALIKAWLETQ